MKYNIIIVDDHKMFLDGVISILENQKDLNIVLTSKDPKQVLKYLEINNTERIDLIITDINMPEISGQELIKTIQTYNRTIKTLVISMVYTPDLIQELIENNIDGFVPKNAQKEELLKSIRTILKGEKYFSKEIKDIYLEGQFLKKKDKEVQLTQREIDVITLIAQEYTTNEIAKKLFLSKHTIESYRKNIIAKLNVRNIAGLTKYAIKKNYVD